MGDNIKKVAVIGNAGGGKTAISRRLAEMYSLPLVHVDSIQFISGMQVRPHKESIEMLLRYEDQEKWLIDGYGPLDIIVKRFAKADKIVFIDFPIWRHYWWCTKRQIKNLWSRRSELPEGCDERSWAHTAKLFKTIWRVHKQMRPELIRILSREQLRSKVVTVRSYSQWKVLAKQGF
ncbi:MAG: flagellar protein FlaR [Bdellovibrio sp.]